MTEAARMARLLGDPTRVLLLEALTAGPLRTSELAGAASMSPAAISRHLQQLRDAGVVERLDVDDDGRGRAYRLRPAALEELAGWLRATSWSATLAAASARPQTSELLARVGNFLDALGTGDVSYFERHLRDDAVLIFPGAFEPMGKPSCLEAVRLHPPYQRYDIVAEPTVQLVGPATTIITLEADVSTQDQPRLRPTFITAVMEEREPWQLVHLQWTEKPTAALAAARS